MLPVLSGWLAASSQAVINEKIPFEPWGGYARVKVAFKGSPEVDAAPGMTGKPWSSDNYRPTFAGVPSIRHFGIYDAKEGGYCICYWRALPPYIEPPADIPPQDLAVLFNLPVLHAINSTRESKNVSALCEPVRGNYIGAVNCQSLMVGVGLSIVAGKIVRRAAAKMMVAAE